MLVHSSDTKYTVLEKPKKENLARHVRFKQIKTDVIGELWLSACGNSNGGEPDDLSCEALKRWMGLLAATGLIK